MPQLFKVADKDLETASPQDPPEPTAETPRTLSRLQSLLGVVQDAHDEDGALDYESVGADDGKVAPDLPSGKEADENGHAVALESAESNETAATAGRDTVSAFQATVRQAQQKVENELLALVEQVRNEMSERHAADLARVAEEAEHRAEMAVLAARSAVEADRKRLREESDQRHATELRQVQENVRSEMMAATKRHAAELVCLREELEQQHAEELKRVCAVALDSFEVLSGRIVQTAP